MPAKRLLILALILALAFGAYPAFTLSSRDSIKLATSQPPSPSAPRPPDPPPWIYTTHPPIPTFVPGPSPIPTTPVPATGTICDIPGRRESGGQEIEYGKLRLYLPAGSKYVLSVAATSFGPRMGVCSIDFNSVVGFDTEGHEVGRAVNHPAGPALLDAVIESIRLTP